MGCACIRILFQRQGMKGTVSRQGAKINDASSLQLQQKPAGVPENESSNIMWKKSNAGSNNVPKKQNYHQTAIFTCQSPVNIIVQDDRLDILQKQNQDNTKRKVEQKIHQPRNKINNNQYELLLCSLQNMESSEMSVFLKGYVLRNIHVEIVPQDDKQKIMIAINLGRDFVTSRLISLKGLVYALVQSLNSVNEAYSMQVPSCIQNSKLQKQHKSNQKSLSNAFAASLFYENLQTKLHQLMIDPLRVCMLWGQQVNKSLVLSNDKSCQQKSSHKMIKRMLTFDQSVTYSLQYQLIECQICLTQISLSFIAPLQGCPHVFHIQCLYEHIKSNINSNITQIRCPIEQCKNYLTANDIENYLDDDLMKKYYKMTLNKYVESNGDVTSWCPTAGCTVVFQYQEGIDMFNCPLCTNSYCLTCRTEYHYDMTCKEYQAMKNLSPQEKTFLYFVKGSKFKQYPKCKFWVERTSGCNTIKCRCGIAFCYECGEIGCGHYTCKNSINNRN